MLPHWTQNDVLVNGVRLHYYRTGHGDKRPLLLVHGFSDTGLLWALTARDLEAEYDVILPDMRGHGLSARVQPDETVDMAADVAELIRTLGLERPIVGGHSMGAMVTFQIGTRFPELASALILEDPPFRLPGEDPTPPPDQPDESPIVKWARSLPGKSMDELLAQYHVEHPTWPEVLVRAMCESKKQLDPNIAEIMGRRLRQDRVSWLTTLQTIDLPMLVFTADPALGASGTPEAAAKVRELKPDATIVHIPDVGHLIRFDRYEAFMEALRAFLKQV